MPFTINEIQMRTDKYNLSRHVQYDIRVTKYCIHIFLQLI